MTTVATPHEGPSAGEPAPAFQQKLGLFDATMLVAGTMIGSGVIVLAGLLPIDALLLLTNIGTLFAFVIVCAAVLIMRRRYPNAERPFRCPWVPFVPVMGVLSCTMLMFSLPWDNWIRLFAWMAIGLVIYFTYGRKHSVMARHLAQELAEHGAGGAYISGGKEADRIQ